MTRPITNKCSSQPVPGRVTATTSAGGGAWWIAVFCVFGGCMSFAVAISAQEVQTSCEWKQSNQAVQDPCPEFCWDVGGQTHCRVLVAETNADLAENRGTLWDSGKLETILPVVEYAGEPLKDSGVYYWRAQVWTKTRPQGFWTEPRRFTLKIRPPLPARWNHVRLWWQFGGDGEWMRKHSDIQWGGRSTHQDHPEWKRFIMQGGLFATMVVPSSKAAALEKFCVEQGVTKKGIAEDMFLHLSSDAIVRLQKANMNLEREPRVIPGWDPGNDQNGDGRVDDDELASLVNPKATARTMKESRLQIYYWSSNGKPDGPKDYIMNVGSPDYQRFVASVYVPEQLKGADGFWSDTCHLGGVPHMFAYQPKMKGDAVGIVEYPPHTKRSCDSDLLGMIARIKLCSPDKVVTGNGWYSTPCLMDGCYFEHLYHIGMGLEELEPIIQRAEEIERRGKLQWLMFTPSFSLAAHAMQARNGGGKRTASEIDPKREQMFALGVYCLIHGRYGYWTIGRHGTYDLRGARKLWFDGIGVDIGKPLGPRFTFAEESPVLAEKQQGEKIVVNGDFEGGLDMPGWQKAGSVRVEEEFAQARRYCAMIESNDHAGNYINKQYVTLKPNTVYRLTFRMRTEDLAGTAQVYPYGFEGADYGGSALRCNVHGTTPWTDYAMAFKTGGDGKGRICFRVFKGRGKAWFDNISLTEGAGEHWKVMAQRFSRGLVLVRLGAAGCSRDAEAAKTFQLDRAYRRVAADGTLSAATDEVSLRNTEGVVLLSVD